MVSLWETFQDGGEERLLERLSQCTAQDICTMVDGSALLHHMVVTKNIGKHIIDAVLQQGADILQANQEGQTPMDLAIKQQNYEAVKVLAAHAYNASLDLPRNNLDTLLEATPIPDDAAALLLQSIKNFEENDKDYQYSILKKALDTQLDYLSSQLILRCTDDCIDRAKLSYQSLRSNGLPQSASAFYKRFQVDKDGSEPKDCDGNTLLHQLSKDLAKDVDRIIGKLCQLGINSKVINNNGDSPLHVAAKIGNILACQALLENGADPLQKNAKNRTPRGQPKVPECVHAILLDAEDVAKDAKKQQQSMLWDQKMKATQTQSAFGLRVV